MQEGVGLPGKTAVKGILGESRAWPARLRQDPCLKRSGHQISQDPEEQTPGCTPAVRFLRADGPQGPEFKHTIQANSRKVRNWVGEGL